MTNKFNEYEELASLIRHKIDSGKLKQQANGVYKISKKFENCEKTIYVEGTDAKDIANKLIYKRDINIKKVSDEEKFGKPFYAVAGEWYNLRIKETGLKEKNVSNYRGLLNNHILPKFKDRGIKTIRNNEIQELLNKKGKTYSCSQVSKMKNIIISIFDYAETNMYIEHNQIKKLIVPKCKKFKNDSKNPVTKEELTLALKATKDQPMMQLAVVMLYVYGLRTCELVNLEWKFVNFDEDYFKIDKSKYTDSLNVKNNEITKRYSPLSPTVKKLLIKTKELHQSDGRKDDMIFHKKNLKNKLDIKPITSDTMDEYFNTLTNRDMEIANGAVVRNNQIIEYTGVRHFTPYAFRKGVITRLNAMNYNDSITQMFVGHAPKEVKDRYYSKMNFEQDLRPNYQRFLDASEELLKECLESAGISI